jgi:hypothetical protein
VAWDFFLDDSQLAVAAAAGASAVTLNVALYEVRLLMCVCVFGDTSVLLCVLRCAQYDSRRTRTPQPPTQQGDVDRLKGLLATTDKLGMDALVEIHNKAELDMALEAGAKIVGVSNRNMDTFELETPSDFQIREWTKPFEETVFRVGVCVAKRQHPPPLSFVFALHLNPKHFTSHPQPWSRNTLTACVCTTLAARLRACPPTIFGFVCRMPPNPSPALQFHPPTPNPQPQAVDQGHSRWGGALNPRP